MPNCLPLDFVLSFCCEMMPNYGEDSYCYSFCDQAGLLGVFDGCGGAGSRKHEYYSDHTEAYIASRLCAGAFYDYFCKTFPCDFSPKQLAEEIFAPKTIQRMTSFQPPKDETGFRVKGSMVRTLPTTAAAALIQQKSSRELSVSSIWAGDSRVYLLNSEGLAQLSVDDTSVPDPMENIYEDGVLRNVFCCDRSVTLHCKTIRVHLPCIVFAATDGCFGYVSTPMEFEGMLLNTLLISESVSEWETRLANVIGGIAGDDHTLCMASFGYSSFPALKKSYAQRFAYLKKHFLLPLGKMPLEDRQSRFRLWNQYKRNYLRFLKDGQV